MLGGKTVLFRPREWRGTTGRDANQKTEEAMAQEINTYPLGTVTYIYLTSDGGANLDTYYNLVPLLEEHVQIVNARAVADLAVQSDQAQRRS